MSLSPSVNLGDTKEWHILDVIYTDLSGEFYKRFAKNALLCINDYKNKKIITNEKGMKGGRAFRQLSFIHDIENYFQHFDYLYLRDSNVSVVGDITPAYSFLSSDALSDINCQARKYDFSVKIIFIMRDPVDRLWSASRHIFDRGNTKFASPKDVLKSIYKSKQHQARTQYCKTISEIENSTINKDNVLYLFYENLFRVSTTQIVSNFLDCNLTSFNIDHKINPSEPCVKDEELSTLVASHYKSTYQFILDKFGREMLNMWPSYKMLG